MRETPLPPWQDTKRAFPSFRLRVSVQGQRAAVDQLQRDLGSEAALGLTRVVGGEGAVRRRPRDVGADVDVCFSGNISVVKIQMW